jgi:alginate O-acetyltransferase complex protein AlgI
MVFSSPEFLFLFLPLVLLCTVGGGERVRNIVLIAWSLLFYYYGSGALVVLLLVSCLVNWALGLALERWPHRGVLVAGLGFNVLTLVYYKYANFLVAQINGLHGTTGFAVDGWQEVVLPVGISFFTFQGMSYVLDVWRREMKAFRNPLDIVLCVAFFPHLIAGPIVRLSHLADQLVHRPRRWEDFSIGAARFTWGLAKKVLIADVCAQVADTGFGLAPADHTAPTAWLALLAYTLQIYFDFSGYSDMAIGLARLFGFRFPENFNHPYAAVSVTDFWRRWHMSLSQWFRDYLYIPLGGNRVSAEWKVYRNLLVVFLVTGLWHGAAWTFVLWGLYHGVILMIERATGVARWPDDRHVLPRRLLTALAVMGSWVLFRSPDAASGLAFGRALVGWGTAGQAPGDLLKLMDVQTLLALATGSLAFFSSRVQTAGRYLESDHPVAARARTFAVLVLLPIVLVQVLASGYSPFLYFQF